MGFFLAVRWYWRVSASLLPILNTVVKQLPPCYNSNNMWQRFIESVFLKRFSEIDLTGLETVAVQNAVQNKYAPALREGIILTILMVPAAFLFDSQILATVLIPITMVSGTAWFAISLATVRMKFQKFGVELTAEVFKSFVDSLGVLGLLTIVSFSGGVATLFAGWVQDSGGGGRNY